MGRGPLTLLSRLGLVAPILIQYQAVLCSGKLWGADPFYAIKATGTTNSNQCW